MAKKKRDSSAKSQNNNGAGVWSEASALPRTSRLSDINDAAHSRSIPSEVDDGGRIVSLFAFMMFLVPAIGVPHEEMLQDTLKSMVAAFALVIAGLLFFWRQRNRSDALRWHALMWLPLALMTYALGSMAWSHAFLGGVEAVRWFLFSLALFLGTNTLSRQRLPKLMMGIHWGAWVASLWTALQFWFDFSFFPQGPNPASTFVNRNFFAEFVVCTIPFSALLLAQARTAPRIALLAFTLAFNVVALMMTGTRGALSALWLCQLIVLPVIAVLYRKQFVFYAWSTGKRLLAVSSLVATVAVLGAIPTGNAKLLAESGSYGVNAFDRAFARTASISTGDSSLKVRLVMWKATARMIQAHPLSGIGAGAWEAVLPLYQTEGSQLETDYYVHNEMLQLLAEYGLAGLVFLLALSAYLLHAAWATVRSQTPDAVAEAPLRAIVLTSLLAFLIVSNIGFPWRLASTGLLFSLGLALLAASDARLQKRGILLATPLPWKPVYSKLLVMFMVGCLVLTAYVSQQAASAEQKITRAVKLSLVISQSGDPNNFKWDDTKRELLMLLDEGIAINPHYRKLTPMAADEMAKWGDWQDAVWVWESVVSSRPYIVAILSNIARGYAQMGQYEKALEYLQRGEKLQPNAASVRSLKITLLSQMGKQVQAKALARQFLEAGTYDIDLVNNAYALAMRTEDWDMAVSTLELRAQVFPALAVDSQLKLGDLYAVHKKDSVRALAAFKAAMNAVGGASDAQKGEIRKRIPQPYLGQLAR